jgi:hypothetical protein
MAITSPTGSSYNFGGRIVYEQNPSPTDPIPAGYAANDGCYWADAPWRSPIASLINLDSWNVQSSAPSGTYGPDYIGILPPEVVAYTQITSPLLRAGSSCTIQFPQKMAINQESVKQPNPPSLPLAEPYGGPAFGFNLLQLTITPTSVTVGRGNTTQVRYFHL